MARLTFRRPAIAANAASIAAPAHAESGLRAAAGVVVADNTGVGPGWFESSLDLWQGLEVREDLPVASAFADLDFWQLGGGRVAASVRCAA